MLHVALHLVVHRELLVVHRTSRVGHAYVPALPKLSQVPASPASVVGLQLIEGMLEGEPHKFTPHSMVKHPARQCPNSAPTPPQGGPGSSGWLS